MKASNGDEGSDEQWQLTYKGTEITNDNLAKQILTRATVELVKVFKNKPTNATVSGIFKGKGVLQDLETECLEELNITSSEWAIIFLKLLGQRFDTCGALQLLCNLNDKRLENYQLQIHATFQIGPNNSDVKVDKVATINELENDLNLPRIKEYDFIVVGAGPTGCVVAGRLSEQFNVLLLEAGGEPTPASQVPFYILPTGFDPDTNYFWPVVPQRYAALDNDGVILSHLGKMLGGSDSHNDMVHNRGSPHDYDNFARNLNYSSWSYANVVQYFKKYENFIGELFTGEYEENYGHDGPLTIDTDTPGILPIWFDVARELGYKIGDPNGNQTESFTPMAKAINKGQRSSAYQSYIKPFKNTRQNLIVIPYSMATQVLIDENKNAYGVVYERHGIPQMAHASKEVFISAGGYADQLEAAEIPVKHEQPAVGDNLGEHLVFQITNIQYNASILPFIPTMPQEKAFSEELKRYQETGEGLLGHLQEGPEAFLVSSRAKEDGQGDWPDIQMVLYPMCPASDEGTGPVSCMFIYLGRTKMRGTIKLNATEYKSGNQNNDVKLAIIDHAIFEGEASTDMEVLLDGIEALFKVINSNTMQKYGMSYNEEPHPACGAHNVQC
ncbi:Oxygen-dependent choline dehydrogenase, partial [Orchesella cincta]